jgi:excisionase family DNA binding protein
MSDVRARLAAVFAPDVVDALEELVTELVEQWAPVTRGNGYASPWLGVDKAAEYLGVSSRTLERRIKAEKVETSTIGRRRLIHRDHLDRLVKGATGRDVAPTTSPRRPV